jgi:hypothetical protein
MKRMITQEQNILRTTLLSTALLCASTLLIQPVVAATLFSDDFESGLGNWSNTTNGDNKSWLRDSGGTTSSATGPSSGAENSSYYVYLETSSGAAYSAGDTAHLVSPSINGAGISLSFNYHMYGSNIGTLAVDVLTPGGWSDDVWTATAQQQTSNASLYSFAEVDLSSYSVSQIRLRATAVGGYRGDIAVDNIVISSVPTGPVAPIFISAEITKPLARENQSYLGSLADDAMDANGDTLVFGKTSGPDWLSVALDGSLSGTPSAADVGENSFVVTASDNALSTSATVKLTVVDRLTPFTVAENNFDQGLGDWTNSNTGDNKDWSTRSGTTPSSGTGPNTGSNGSSHYLYLETSSGQAYVAGDSANFLSPTISSENLSLEFDYHMYGSDIGTLSIDVLTNGSWVNDVWSLTAQQQTSNAQAYETASVDLASYQVSQVRFRAIANGGYRGDIAIDNIALISTPQPDPVAPQFSADSLTLSDAEEGVNYTSSIADSASDANDDPLIFSKISGPTWLTLTAEGQLSGQPTSSDIGSNSFVVEVSDGVLTDTATLLIEVNEDSSAPVISSSDFESDLGDWFNVTGDDSDWIRRSGYTPTSFTGPSGGADGSAYYMYIETSDSATIGAGDSVILESKAIIGGSDIHLVLQHHMNGSSIGRLSVDVFDGLAWINDVFDISGAQQSNSTDPFLPLDIDLSSWSVEKLRLRVTTIGGSSGDIAIDSIMITGNGTIDDTTPVKIAFVTAQSFTGDLGGLVGADTKCQAEANSAGLPGTFKAFLSDNRTSAASRLNHASIPYETVNGDRIAADWTDLTDRIIDNPLNVTPTGTTVSGFAWTGSDHDGTKASYIASDYPYDLDLTCENWSFESLSSRSLGGRGNVNDVRAWADWWQRDGSACSSQLGLYCLEQ